MTIKQILFALSFSVLVVGSAFGGYNLFATESVVIHLDPISISVDEPSVLCTVCEMEPLEITIETDSPRI